MKHPNNTLKNSKQSWLEKKLYYVYDPNLVYEYFLPTFIGILDHAFPLKEVIMKLKTCFESRND